MLYVKLYLLIGLLVTWWCIRWLRSPIHRVSKPWPLGCFAMVFIWFPLVLSESIRWTRAVPIEWCIDYFKLKLG